MKWWKHQQSVLIQHPSTSTHAGDHAYVKAETVECLERTMRSTNPRVADQGYFASRSYLRTEHRYFVQLSTIQHQLQTTKTRGRSHSMSFTLLSLFLILTHLLITPLLVPSVRVLERPHFLSQLAHIIRLQPHPRDNIAVLPKTCLRQRTVRTKQR